GVLSNLLQALPGGFLDCVHGVTKPVRVTRKQVFDHNVQVRVKKRAQELPPESQQTGPQRGGSAPVLTVTPSGLELPGRSALRVSLALSPRSERDGTR